MATTTKKTPTRAVKRTKAEIDKEFTDLRSQVQETRQETSAKVEELARVQEAEVREAVREISVEGVTQRISTLSRQVEARFEQQILLLKKEAESDKRLADLRIKTLEDSLAQAAAQIATLQKQLDEAKKQVQDIAVKAIEGASGARTLAHINDIAMEQAKHRSPQS